MPINRQQIAKKKRKHCNMPQNSWLSKVFFIFSVSVTKSSRAESGLTSAERILPAGKGREFLWVYVHRIELESEVSKASCGIYLDIHLIEVSFSVL